jgi:hypothetical protein
MECHGYVVGYLPIEYRYRVGVSKIQPLRDTVNFFSLVLRVVMYFKPLKIFMPLSGIMFLAGGTLGGYEKLQGLPLGGAALLLLVGAVQVAALGLLADLLVKRGR